MGYDIGWLWKAVIFHRETIELNRQVSSIVHVAFDCSTDIGSKTIKTTRFTITKKWIQISKNINLSKSTILQAKRVLSDWWNQTQWLLAKSILLFTLFPFVGTWSWNHTSDGALDKLNRWWLKPNLFSKQVHGVKKNMRQIGASTILTHLSSNCWLCILKKYCIDMYRSRLLPWVCAYVYIYIHIYFYIYIYIYTHDHMWVYVYMHIYIHIHWFDLLCIHMT
jgi:hypothetical protein